MFADKPFYTRVALWGLGIFLVNPLLVIAAAILSSDAEVLGFLVILLIPTLIAFAAVYFWKKWGLLIGLLVSILGFMFVADIASHGLTMPNSFFDFSFSLFGLVGVVFLFLGCVIGFWQEMRGTSSQESNPTFTMAVKGALGIIVVLAVISAILTIANLNSVSAEDEADAEILIAKKTEFDRESIPVSASGTTKIVVKNKDAISHTFTVKDLGIDEDIPGFGEKLIEIESPSSGEYFFICTISGHDDMVGKLEAR